MFSLVAILGFVTFLVAVRVGFRIEINVSTRPEKGKKRQNEIEMKQLQFAFPLSDKSCC